MPKKGVDFDPYMERTYPDASFFHSSQQLCKVEAPVDDALKFLFASTTSLDDG